MLVENCQLCSYCWRISTEEVYWKVDVCQLTYWELLALKWMTTTCLHHVSRAVCVCSVQLAAPDRLYLRHDLVTMPTRKDQQYCLWLFSDIALISCVKRKPTSVSRRTSILLYAALRSFLCSLLQLYADIIMYTQLTRSCSSPTFRIRFLWTVCLFFAYLFSSSG